MDRFESITLIASEVLIVSIYIPIWIDLKGPIRPPNVVEVLKIYIPIWIDLKDAILPTSISVSSIYIPIWIDLKENV